MTLWLLLIRAATSEAGRRLDWKRRLTPEGCDEAARMGRWIEAQGFAPAEVLSSPAWRTRETLKIMLPLWPRPPRVSYEQDLWGAGQTLTLVTLDKATEDVVAVVSHNNAMGQLANRLADRAPDHPGWSTFPPASVAVLAFDIESWEASETVPGTLVAFATPDDVP